MRTRAALLAQACEQGRELADGVRERLEETARTVYRVLKIRGIGRIDVRLTAKDEVVVVEAMASGVPVVTSDSGATATLFGVYAAGDDVWVAGDDGILLRYRP